MPSTQYDWDAYFLNIADAVRQRSKDPNSKIGAVAVGESKTILATGYNGFASRIADTPERWERPAKYKRVVHAEANVCYSAANTGISLNGATLYLFGFGPPTVPCLACANALIQSGIKRIVGQPYKEVPESWSESLEDAMEALDEAGVRFCELGCLCVACKN